MLSLSILSETGEPLNLDGLTDPNCTEIEGIPNSNVLLRFANAFMGSDPDELTAAREVLVEQMSPEAMVDAAGIASNFQRMTRIADATGIPLEEWGDEEMDGMTNDLIKTLGTDKYGSAVNTPDSVFGANTTKDAT